MSVLILATLLLYAPTGADAGKKKKKKKKGVVSGFSNKGRAGGAPPKISDESRQLFEKLEDGDMVAVEELLSAGAATDSMWESSPSCDRAPCQPLHTAVVASAAACRDDVECKASTPSEGVRLLAAAGAPMDGMDKKKRSPLHLAATHGAAAIASQLLELGASAESKNEAGATPLYIAISEGHLSCVEALLAKGADPNTSNKAGQSALFNALFWNQGEIALKLIEAGADVSKPDRKGNSLRQKLSGSPPKLQELLVPAVDAAEAQAAAGSADKEL